jgi:trigger factor
VGVRVPSSAPFIYKGSNMSVTETLNDGLKREYQIVIAKDIIQEKCDKELTKVAKKAKIDGFRPGKAPKELIKKQYFGNIFADAVDGLIADHANNYIKENELKAAFEPKITVETVAPDADLTFKMYMELMPEFDMPDFSKLSLAKYVAEVGEEEIEENIKNILEMQKNFVDADESYKAKEGDAVIIDFVGKLDGVAFDGGTGSDHQLVLGSKSFIAGFEEQLIGAKKDDKIVVKVTFPEKYHSADLAGKEAEFDVVVKSTQLAEKSEFNEDFAKKIGFDSVEAVRNLIKDSRQKQLESTSQYLLKKNLLDALEKVVDFPLPPTMVDTQFKELWQDFENEKKRDPNYGSSKSEDEFKAEYEALTNRRVKLGILMSEVASNNEFAVTQAELRQAMLEETRKYPGQEMKVMEFYKNNPEMVTNLRGPIIEDKVVDFILKQVKLEDKKVSSKELNDLFAK